MRKREIENIVTKQLSTSSLLLVKAKKKQYSSTFEKTKVK